MMQGGFDAVHDALWMERWFCRTAVAGLAELLPRKLVPCFPAKPRC